MEIEFSTQFSILGHILLAVILGGIVGLERETQGKPAGLRTHMLVSAASAMFAILGEYVIQNYRTVGDDIITADPTRIIQSVVLGISFIGSGLIIKHPERNEVKNLTTAGTTLVASAIGVCVATHLYLVAFGLSLMVVIITAIVKKFE